MLGSKATTFLISLLDFNYKQKNLSYPITKKNLNSSKINGCCDFRR